MESAALAFSRYNFRQRPRLRAIERSRPMSYRVNGHSVGGIRLRPPAALGRPASTSSRVVTLLRCPMLRLSRPLFLCLTVALAASTSVRAAEPASSGPAVDYLKQIKPLL